MLCLVTLLFDYNCEENDYDYLDMACIMNVTTFNNLVARAGRSNETFSDDCTSGGHACGFSTAIDELQFTMQPLTSAEATTLLKFKKAEKHTECTWYIKLMECMNETTQ